MKQTDETKRRAAVLALNDRIARTEAARRKAVALELRAQRWLRRMQRLVVWTAAAVRTVDTDSKENAQEVGEGQVTA